MKFVRSINEPLRLPSIAVTGEDIFPKLTYKWLMRRCSAINFDNDIFPTHKMDETWERMRDNNIKENKKLIGGLGTLG